MKIFLIASGTTMLFLAEFFITVGITLSLKNPVYGITVLGVGFCCTVGTAAFIGTKIGETL